jgi:hypothetical protein
MHLCSIFQALQNTWPAVNGVNYKIIRYSDYATDDPGIGVGFGTWEKHFSFLHSVQTGFSTHPESYLCVPGALSLSIKRTGREADLSPPSRA